MTWKGFLLSLATVFFGMVLFAEFIVHAAPQAITPTTPYQQIFTGVHTSCQLSIAGQTNLCGAGDGIWLSVNGSAYFQVTAPVAVAPPIGVTGIIVNGNAVQTGVVTLKIPSTATTTASTTIQ